MQPEPEAVLRFWLADALASPEALAARTQIWFGADPALDCEIARRFGAWVERAGEGALGEWMREPRAALALVILLDQFPRNLFRGGARSFAFDARALEASSAALTAGHDRVLHPLESIFLYLPFEHAESLAAQDQSVALFEAAAARAESAHAEAMRDYADFARRHRDVIRRFGRFPHRNAVLGRATTAEEAAYLAGGGETFGGGRRGES